MDLDIPMSQNILQLQQNGTINVDHANSLTDSTPDLNEVNNVVLSWENVSDNLSNIQTMYDNPVVSEATVRLIPNPANADDNLVINLDDSSSEDSMDSDRFQYLDFSERSRDMLTRQKQNRKAAKRSKPCLASLTT
ncbi:hypothetical protein F2Q68_00038800 [Brassica cretica]|uniref:Uncharacterized protein n=1 Tax=Brassica cretica TaxID=69181 RepID=A0A8S9MGC7_BRACR|nr:hypothetical protein F2Q68_00038800 [Brassica cretica]